jgi:hypothetical protein
MEKQARVLFTAKGVNKMEQGQTCTHGNLNWCDQGCFTPAHEDDYLVTLEITVKAKSRDDAFSKVEKLLPYPLRVCLYDAEVAEATK